MEIRRDPAHLVMNRRYDRNGILNRVDVRKFDCNLANTRQTLHDRLGPEVIKFKQHIIAIRTTSAPFLNLLIHRTGNKITRCKILERRCIPLHKAFAMLVEQNPALAADPFSHQHPGTGHAGRVELPKLHVLEGHASASGHPHAVARVDERIGRCSPDPARAPSGQHRGFGLQHHDLSRLHFEGHHTDNITIGVANKVERHPFDKKLSARADVSLIERMQHRVAGAICRGASALNGLLTKVGGMPAKWPLINRAIRIPVEWHSKVLEFVDHLRRHPAHELDRVLVAEIIRPLNGVEHMPVPVVLAHIAQRSPNPPLRRDGMRAGWKDFGQDRDVETGFGQLQRATHPGPAGPNHHDVELATLQPIGEFS